MMKQRQKSPNWPTNYRKLDKESGSEDETELFIRNKPPNKEIPSVEKHIEDGDTLQRLAIKYRCTIEDLKRLNNIHKENEIFAKRTIKVPARSFSMLPAEVHGSGKHSPKEPTTQTDDITTFTTKLTENLLTIPNGKKELLEVNDIIFNTSITQISPDRLNSEVLPDEINEEVRLLPSRELPVAESVVTKLNCSGADFDISWIALVVCIVIVIVAFPLIYVLYIAEHPEQYHHQKA